MQSSCGIETGPQAIIPQQKLYVSGDWCFPLGELRRAYAHVKGTVEYTLPDGGMVFMFSFQYDGYDAGYQYRFYSEVDESGEWAKIYTRPSTVIYIISTGRVGYGHEVDGVLYYVLDTRGVSAFIPFI